jgi:aminoglycoside phosphotransferase (APT) family kinase protein
VGEIEPEDVRAYLSAKLGTSVAINSIKQTFPGASRETWLIDADVAGEQQGFALRIDLPEGSCVPLPLEREFEVYRRLFRSEVPVAEPLWFDQDIEFAQGRAHMVRRLVDGSTNIAGLSDMTAAGAALRKSVAFEAMEKLALVHNVDWESLGLGDVLPRPTSAASSMREEFDLWCDFWDADRKDADPVLAEALCWLQEQAPTDTPKIMLVKGNNGVGEEIFRDGKIVALSDWELCSLGDGALDLGFSQGTMQLGDFDEILGHYEQCVGSPVSPKRLAFSGFTSWLKHVVCLRSNMLGAYREGRTDRLIGLSMGIVFAETARSRIARCIGKDMVESWREVMSEERNIYAGLGGKAK